MKIILVSIILALSFWASAQKESAFFMQLKQVESKLETDPESAYKLLKKLEKDTARYAKKEKRELYLCFSAYHKSQGDYEHEREALQQSLVFGTPPKIRSEIYYKLAANASRREEYHEAIDYLTKIFHLKKYAPPLILAKAETLMGATYVNIDEYETAESYLLRAIQSYNKIPEKAGLLHVYINLGVSKHKTGNPAQALHYFHNALTYLPEDDLANLAFIKTNIGGELVDIRKYDSAEVYIADALEIIHLIGDLENERSCMNNLAIIRRNRGQFREALGYFRKALEIDERTGSREQMKELYLNLSEVYEELGDTKASLDYYKRYTDLKNALFNEEKALFIYNARERYKASERQKQIAELKIAKQQKETETLNMRYILLSGSIFAALVLLALFAYFRIKALRTRNANRLALISASLDAEERERLRISQEIHDDLGGILGMSRMLFSNTKKILKPQDEELYERIDQLLVLANSRSRAISHELFSPTLKTFGLVKALEEQLDHVRFAHPGMETELDADADFRPDPAIELNLFRISQELINNSLKYSEAGQIRISLKKSNEQVLFTYSDNGKGFDPARVKKGVGLNSIDSRVQRFDGQSTLKTAPNKGFQVEIRLPFQA